MPELEIHHESEHAIDPTGQKVGVLAAVLAVMLAVVTIASHRTHTSAILHNSEANDAWAHYQSTRVKFHNLELGANLAAILDAHGDAARKMLAETVEQKKKYDEQGKEIQGEARHAEGLAREDEKRALRYDFGEGLLEIGLVLSSLYFISHKMMFPAMGIAAGVAGIVIAAAGLLI
jgi:hypothetical protein